MFNYVSFRDFGAANEKALAKAEKEIEWAATDELLCGMCGAHLLPSAVHRKWNYDERSWPPYYPGSEMGDPSQCGNDAPTVVAGGEFW